ncbi:MAG TPA: glycoside hydrolase family 88 protein, partial [Woeseiaceae bacterium]|nr:glycoside hydrolase family 88 protein [Woeseiaceae bacterium]
MARRAVYAVLLLCGVQAVCAQPDSVRAIGDRVASWQLAHMENFGYLRSFRDQSADPLGWIQAAFYIGLARWAEATGDTAYREALLARAEANEWQLGDRTWHADDQAIAQVYLYLARTGGPARLDAVVDAFDRILAAPPRNSLEFSPDDTGRAEATCQRRWCWCDALFMAPPAWAMLSRVTGDPKYREYALGEYFATRDALYDEQAHLFYRDSRFFARRSEFGNRIFWSRGNGWVFAGLPLLLESLPETQEGYEELLALYREMAGALAAMQHDSGYWAPSLLDVAQDPLPETSGTAFITFGLAWGVKRGLIPAERYEPVVERGWQALIAAVDDKG